MLPKPMLSTQTSGQAKPATISLSEITLPSASTSDEALIAQVLQGDSNAYGRLMRRYNQRMYRVARSIVKQDADALDIVQEAHIKAYRNIGKYRGDSAFSSWLAAITRNQALMFLRQTKREVNMADNDSNIVAITSQVEADTTSNQQASPEKCLENKELRALINHKVDLLPDDFRAVFVLRMIEQLSVKETAEILEIKAETVKTRLFRAKRLLREQIQATLELAGMHVYEVGGIHCDAIVANVMNRIQQIPTD